MATSLSKTEQGAARLSAPPAEIAAALVATALMLCFHAMLGFPRLSDINGDNDSLLRLVEVRDLIAGQGWFDLWQYRMGPAGGFEMHWSRLVDAPIAAIVVLASTATGSQALGEAAGAILWPSLLYFASTYFLVGAARSLAGPIAILPAALIGGITLHLTGVFAPASLDHHNVQLTLALAMTACLAAPRPSLFVGLTAGASAALMLAVGVETLPIVAAGGLCVALGFLFGGEREVRRARLFGLGFAAAAFLAFAATVSPAHWLRAQCDAFSIAQFLPALLGGLGLTASTAFAPRWRGGRFAALALLALAATALVAFAFPQCLDDPYAGVNERLRVHWLDEVAEARSIVGLWSVEPAALARYATPLLALAVVAGTFRRRGLSAAEWTVALMLAAAFAVSLWQVRGAIFALPLSVIPLSGWVAGFRARAAHAPANTPGPALKAGAAWLLSFNFVWATAANAAVSALWRQPKAPAAAAETVRECYDRRDYARLATLPAARVLAISNLGAPILGFTPHSALAGPYHRNTAGNLLALDAWLANERAAEAMVRKSGAGLLAFCAGNAETRFLARQAPDGLLASLASGVSPDWLEPLPGGDDDALLIYRIRQP